jgi:hypothetical protein
MVCNICLHKYSLCSHTAGTIYGSTLVPATPNTYHIHNSNCPIIFVTRFLNYGYGNKSIPIKNYSYSSVWQIPMDAAVNSWNSSNTSINFYKCSNTNNKITVSPFSFNEVGKLKPIIVSGTELVEFEIQLNSTTITNNAVNLNNYIQSVFVHELGHAIWLEGNPTTTEDSIMKYSRNRNTMIAPSSFDEASVNMKY